MFVKMRRLSGLHSRCAAERGIGTIAQDRSRQTVIFTTGQIASLLFVHVVKIQTHIVDAPRLIAFPAGEGDEASVR